MLQDFHKLITMGVMNITPNSFSDPNKFLNRDHLLNTLKNLDDRSDLILDFGFESTAPMNEAISALEEKKRFDVFFDEIKDINLSNRWISFDTYRPENFSYFERQFMSRYKNMGFIFNDVSGVVDDNLINLLKDKKRQKNFYYLYSSTHIPSREFVLKHMDYVKMDEDIQDSTIKKFSDAIEIFQSSDCLDQIILDPCFGFSKSYEQNWQLLNKIENVVNEIKKQNFKGAWLVGISKKSFLRKSLQVGKNTFEDAEILHLQLIKQILLKNLGQIIFRTHDFNIVHNALKELNA